MFRILCDNRLATFIIYKIMKYPNEITSLKEYYLRFLQRKNQTIRSLRKVNFISMITSFCLLGRRLRIILKFFVPILTYFNTLIITVRVQVSNYNLIELCIFSLWKWHNLCATFINNFFKQVRKLQSNKLDYEIPDFKHFWS